MNRRKKKTKDDMKKTQMEKEIWKVGLKQENAFNRIKSLTTNFYLNFLSRIRLLYKFNNLLQKENWKKKGGEFEEPKTES